MVRTRTSCWTIVSGFCASPGGNRTSEQKKMFAGLNLTQIEIDMCALCSSLSAGVLSLSNALWIRAKQFSIDSKFKLHLRYFH